MTTEPKSHRSKRLYLALAALALAGSTALVTWWTTTLVGLPDVGDPFDVAAFERPIPDETNAFVLFKQAAALLPKAPENLTGDWRTAGPAERDWLARGRESLEIWRQGTEKTDALYINPGVIHFDTRLDVAQALRTFVKMGLLQGSKLEQEGDFAGALEWYRALLRSSRLCGKRGTFIERLIGVSIHNLTCTRLTRWAADPGVDAKLLRLALDAAIEADALTSPLSDGLKVEYLGLLHLLDDPNLILKLHDYDVVPNGQGGSTTVFGQGGWKSTLIGVRRRVLNEPERSRRVIRLIFANWLAYSDLPDADQPPRALTRSSPMASGPARELLAGLYLAGAEAPSPARALGPEKLAQWYATTMDARNFLPNFEGMGKMWSRERAAQASLLVTLANELHKREHGGYPERVEDLVGPYLKKLPPGYQTSR